MLRAAPQSALPSAKSAIAPSIAARRPKTCASPPAAGSSAVAASEYALAAHTKSVPARSCTIVGSAVDTAVCGRRQRERRGARRREDARARAR